MVKCIITLGQTEKPGGRFLLRKQTEVLKDFPDSRGRVGRKMRDPSGGHNKGSECDFV